MVRICKENGGEDDEKESHMLFARSGEKDTKQPGQRQEVTKQETEEEKQAEEAKKAEEEAKKAEEEAKKAEEAAKLVYQDEQYKITFDKAEVHDFGDEREFCFYFDIENKSGGDIVVSSTGAVINGRELGFGYTDIPAAAGEMVNKWVGYADHDYMGDSGYVEWLEQASDEGLKTLSISFAIKDASGTVLVNTPTVELKLD